MTQDELISCKSRILEIAKSFGFADMRVANAESAPGFERFKNWLAQGYHGDMGYLARNLELREKPALLHPGTLRLLSFRYPYLPSKPSLCGPLEDSDKANISRYALGRDYHKFLRKKLQTIAQTVSREVPLSFRVFVDSAPVMETAFAEKSGLGWKGKHTLLINQSEGSWFFLGEIFVDLPLPVDPPTENLCGGCSACISICPTAAIIAPYTLDARRCISYLTIEHHGAIPEALRPLMGNHIYGCDDCQAICPWNRFAVTNQQDDFAPRNNLDSASLLELWQWSEADFLKKLEGSPIRRIGYQKWLRNLAIALGNSEPSPAIIEALKGKQAEANDMVSEHIDWALAQQTGRLSEAEKEARNSTKNKTRKLCQSIQKMTPQLC